MALRENGDGVIDDPFLIFGPNAFENIGKTILHQLFLQDAFDPADVVVKENARDSIADFPVDRNANRNRSDNIFQFAFLGLEQFLLSFVIGDILNRLHHGVMIDRFIEGNHRFVSPEITKEDIRSLCGVLHRLHGIEGCSSEFYPFQRYDSYKLRSGVSLNPEEEGNISAKVRSFYSKEPLVLCHNDLVHDNILRNEAGQIVLIDYEFAGLNNELFDLASVLSENKIFDWDKVLYLVKTYFGAAYQESHYQKTVLWMAYENYLWFYWAACRYKETHYQGFQDIANDKKDAIVITRDYAKKHPEIFAD